MLVDGQLPDEKERKGEKMGERGDEPTIDGLAFLFGGASGCGIERTKMKT